MLQFKFLQSRREEKALAQLSVIPRRWGFLPTLDGYVLREFLIKLSILLLVFVILFLLGDVFNDLEDFLNKKAPILSILSYLMLKLPGNIRFVLPISVLLGCMWTMAAFGKNLEVTAMRASGVSLFRCGGSIFLVGLLVSGLNIYFNEALVPYTEREAFVLQENLTKGVVISQEMLTYRSADRKRTWLFKEFDTDKENDSVMLKRYRDDGTLDWDIFAKESKFVPGQGWTFMSVIRTGYTLDGLMPHPSETVKELNFTLSEIPETPEDIAYAIKDEEELPTWVILRALTQTEGMSDRMRGTYWTVFFYRIAFPWACFLAVFLGVPLATKNERSGIMLSIITAVAMIVAYIVLAQVFLVLGKRGTLNPVLAGLSPTLMFIAYGYYKVVFDRN